jgi:hypothetical protein
MLQRTTARALPVVHRAVEVAPAAQACCGVCRSCMTTNVVGLAVAGATGAACFVRRALEKLAGRR